MKKKEKKKRKQFHLAQNQKDNSANYCVLHFFKQSSARIDHLWTRRKTSLQRMLVWEEVRGFEPKR
jgi:hypothetical protein